MVYIQSAERSTPRPRNHYEILPGETIEVINIYHNESGALCSDLAVTAVPQGSKELENMVFRFKWLPLKGEAERTDGNGKVLRPPLWDIVTLRAKNELGRCYRNQIQGSAI